MSVENLKDALPEYAKDLKLNLGSITRTTVLNEEQLWGTLLASAAATRNTQVLAEIGAEAADNPVRRGVPSGAGSRVDHGHEQRVLPWPRLPRRQVRRSARGVADEHHRQSRAWTRRTSSCGRFAVSSINGCPHCVVAHEHTLREAGVTREAIQEALKAAAIISGVAQAITTAQTLATVG